MLVGQAMGLGGWIHASVAPPYILQRDPSKGWFGLGFRLQSPGKKWHDWPPVPSTQPNPVGIDGVLQALCPPYVQSMDHAVDQVLAEKYDAQGTYGDVELFKQSYRAKKHAVEFLRNADHYSKGAIEYTKEICNTSIRRTGASPRT
jgi:hypothetical protein